MTVVYKYDFPGWRLYQSLEGDLKTCFRYVPPISSNYDVYSEEFAKIIVSSAIEIESTLLSLKRELGLSGEKDIRALHSCLTSKYPNGHKMIVSVPRYSWNFSPLEDWSNQNAPEWWGIGYNKFKHDRENYPGASSLRRAVYLLGSLQIVLLHYYRLKFGYVSLPASLAPELIEPKIAYFQDYYGPTPTVAQWFWRLPDDPITQTE